MTKKRRSNSSRSRRAANIHVIAVSHPPKGKTTEAALAKRSPYLTDHGLAEFFGAIGQLVPKNADFARMSIDERIAIGTPILDQLENQFPPVPTEALPAMLAAIFAFGREKLFEGMKRNPVYAIEAFVAHHEEGLYPPLWVLNWLNEAFKAYLSTKGSKGIDQLLGTKRRQGQTLIFKEAATNELEFRMMREIASLTFLGITIEEAAIMVARRLETATFKCPSPETLAERFVKRGWSKLFAPYRHFGKEISAEEKNKVFALYPADVRPHRTRRNRA